MLWMLLTGLALAGGYTLDDIVAATRRGMSAEAIESMATASTSTGPMALSPSEVASLLRAGVSASVIQILTGGAEPTEESLSASKSPGPVYGGQAAPAVPSAPVGPPPRTPEQALEFQAIETAPGTADELYRRARAWYSRVFNNSSAVLDLEDPVDHRLVGKANVPFSQSFPSGSDATRGVIRYTVTVETKDGRYRATIGTFVHQATTSSGYAVDFGVLSGLQDPGPNQCSQPKLCVAESWRVRVWSDLKATATTAARPLLTSLVAEMATPAAPDDW